MNKYMFLAVLVLFIVFITYVADFTTAYDATIGTPNPITGLPSQGSATYGSLTSLVNTWWKLATFRITGVPMFFIVIIFYPVNLAVIYMIVDILKDLVPLT